MTHLSAWVTWSDFLQHALPARENSLVLRYIPDPTDRFLDGDFQPAPGKCHWSHYQKHVSLSSGHHWKGVHDEKLSWAAHSLLVNLFITWNTFVSFANPSAVFSEIAASSGHLLNSLLCSASYSLCCVGLVPIRIKVIKMFCSYSCSWNLKVSNLLFNICI